MIEPARVFDGESLHSGWRVVVRGERIEAAGPASGVAVPTGAERLVLENATLLPGLIEAHSHVLLHAYDEASWNDQVLKEPRSLRVVRATNHLRDTLLAGFTTIRDLGTEGAAYDDAGLKQAVEQGILIDPRMIVTTRAIVATGSYGPKGFDPEWDVPLGAEPADSGDLVRVVAGRSPARLGPTDTPARHAPALPRPHPRHRNRLRARGALPRHAGLRGRLPRPVSGLECSLTTRPHFRIPYPSRDG